MLGDILGHEFMDIVEEIESEVTKTKRGDRFVIASMMACGDFFSVSKSCFLHLK